MFESNEIHEQPGAPTTFITRMAYKVGGGVAFGLVALIAVPYFIFVGLRAKMKKEDPQAAILESKDKIVNFLSS